MITIKFIKRTIALIGAALIFLSNSANTVFNGDVYPFESNTKVVGFETFVRSQAGSLIQPRTRRILRGSSSGIRLRALSWASLMTMSVAPLRNAELAAAETSRVICLRK